MIVLDYKDKIKLFINDQESIEEYLDNLSVTIVEYINKYDKICMCFTNSYSFRYIYRKIKAEFKKAENLIVCVFDKPMGDIPKNLSIIYANQDFRAIAKEAVRIISENNRVCEEVLLLPDIKKINIK